ncbi:hypothetical protein ONZ45_g17257 [Pleurotus djamor]|nr:hypothetical protein ONZ45_g17257 [Pleurotus djamor]
MPISATSFPPLSMPTQLSPAASVAAMSKALEEAQLTIDRLTEELSASKDEVAELRAQLKGKRGRTKRGSTLDENPEEQERESIRDAARRFVVENALWLPSESLVSVKPPRSVKDYYLSSTTGNRKELWATALAVELYEAIPSSLHPRIRLKTTEDDIREAMNSKRQNIIHKIKVAAPTILNLPLHVFQTPDSLDRMRLLKWDPNSATFDTLPPILYPADNDKAVFMNEALPKIYRVAVFTEAALLDNTKPPPANCAGMKWGIKSVTVGGIALAATIATFLLSGDSQLTPLGSIPYEQNFHHYRALLYQAMSTGPGSYWESLEKFYMSRVFYDVSPSTTTTTSTSGRGSIPSRDLATAEDFTAAIREAAASILPRDTDDNNITAVDRTNAETSTLPFSSNPHITPPRNGTQTRPPTISPPRSPSPALSYIEYNTARLGLGAAPPPALVNNASDGNLPSHGDPALGINEGLDPTNEDDADVQSQAPVRGKGRGRGGRRARGRRAAGK